MARKVDSGIPLSLFLPCYLSLCLELLGSPTAPETARTASKH